MVSWREREREGEGQEVREQVVLEWKESGEPVLFPSD